MNFISLSGNPLFPESGVERQVASEVESTSREGSLHSEF